jgi:hypothetical protein
MKLRLSALLILGVAGIFGFILFKTSQNVQETEYRLRSLKVALVKEQDALRVLETEWDYLNRPDRLEGLVKQHLNMAPSKPAALVRNSSEVPKHFLPLPPRKPVMQAHTMRIEQQNKPVEKPAPRENPAPQDSGRRFDDLLSDLTGQEPGSGGQP